VHWLRGQPVPSSWRQRASDRFSPSPRQTTPLIPSSSSTPIATVVFSIAASIAAAASPAETPAPQPVAPALAGELAFPYSDHAVVQQKIPLPVWGTSCLPDTIFTVRLHGQTKETVTDWQGEWRITLDPMTADTLTSVNEAPAGREMVITFEKDGARAERVVTDLIVSSPGISEPVAVRYAYTTNPNGPLLYNKDGLPAAPLATEEHGHARRGCTRK
jgi:hypothetical protein